MAVSGSSTDVSTSRTPRLPSGVGGSLRGWAANTLAPAIAFAVTGYAVGIAVSAYTIFVLGIFDPKFSANGSFEIARMVLAVVWSFYCATFLLGVSAAHLAIVYWHPPNSTPETTNLRVAYRILIGFVLGATLSVTISLLEPRIPFVGLLFGTFAGACFCLLTRRIGRWLTRH